ncbi:acyl-CoA dehydrogenase, partial [Burkholderia contaminans]
MSLESLESFDAWVGRSEDHTDRITQAPVRLLRATLDYANPSELPATLPPLWHWLYFLPGERQSNIGVDGHPQRGGFLPPVTLPRRMWAGGRLQFLRPLAVDA